ncbi:guanine nucleotide-binding protein G(q) subunit alpha-like [Lucilia sericata]|uniref:guanine nucleotide-binding protein G(q) subunit alpha-like n=1 Tax=Lucilia sericata TaxID=13632 RepID=UPI0018A8285E|nr:guanine nucleotide-binding protein G(q) subunit alpha-like [Lucilia sericata]
MNCLCSEEIRAQIFKIKDWKEICKFTNGSGKSTFIRQMRYETHMPYDSTKYVGIIIQNIFYAMQTMIEAMKVFQIPYKTKVNAELWADAGIQECFMRGHQYGLLDSTKYFFSHLDRIANPHYTPSIQDILRARIPSKGFQEHVFKYKNVEFLIADVGYQSTERKKWIHCFDNVTAIIYMVAISEYDQFSLDSKHGNSLKESIELLNSIMSFQYFQDTALIIVFNKLDIFEEKITYSHLADYFPEYSGSPSVHDPNPYQRSYSENHPNVHFIR